MVSENLIEIRKKHSFNVNNLQKWLKINIEEFGKILSIKQFVGGQSNPTFFITSEEGKEIILRKKPPGKLLPGAHQIEREYRIMKALANTKVPVPKVYALCEDENILGRAFYVMDYVEGRVFSDDKLPSMKPQERAAVYDHLNYILRYSL